MGITAHVRLFYSAQSERFKIMKQKDYAALSTHNQLAHWRSYQPTTPAMATLKRRAVRHLTDKLNAETAEHLNSLAF